MRYLEELEKIYVLRFLGSYHNNFKNYKVKSEMATDHMCDFGHFCDVVLYKDEKVAYKYNIDINDFYFKGMVKKGTKFFEPFDYSEAWQNYISILMKKGMIKGDYLDYEYDSFNYNNTNKETNT